MISLLKCVRYIIAITVYTHTLITRDAINASQQKITKHTMRIFLHFQASTSARTRISSYPRHTSPHANRTRKKTHTPRYVRTSRRNRDNQHRSVKEQYGSPRWKGIIQLCCSVAEKIRVQFSDTRACMW